MDEKAKKLSDCFFLIFHTFEFIYPIFLINSFDE